MPLDNPKVGMGFAAEFQSSALPWVTSSVAPAAGSPVYFDFQRISRFITISNRDSSFSNSLSFAFTRNGIISGTGGMGQQKYILQGGQSVSIETRVRYLFLQGETGTPPYSVFAGLTNVDNSQMPVLTGTLPNGSASWANIG